MPERRRIKHTETLEERFASEAKRLRVEAEIIRRLAGRLN
jgi:hypothetical protein